MGAEASAPARFTKVSMNGVHAGFTAELMAEQPPIEFRGDHDPIVPASDAARLKGLVIQPEFGEAIRIEAGAGHVDDEFAAPYTGDEVGDRRGVDPEARLFPFESVDAGVQLF